MHEYVWVSEVGANVSAIRARNLFWIRTEMLLGEPLEQFLANWQIKRDGQRRGIVEISP